MLPSYDAILRAGRLDWLGEAPPQSLDGRAVRVKVTCLGAPASSNGMRMSEALGKLAETSAAAAFGNPLDWQRDARADRDLPGTSG